jgi:metal-responsive CopG/Arc/MetJ family transcriptional regulator
MKAAVSIPDDVFGEGERLARRLKTSRSQLYAKALAQFVAQHDDNQITARMNAVVEQVGTGHDPFMREAARRLLGREKW